VLDVEEPKRLVMETEDASRLAQERLAVGSEDRPAALPLDQGTSHRGFQSPDVLADGGLAQVQRVPRPLKAAAVRDSHETAQWHDVQNSVHGPTLA